ncbi:MAG: segregation/condensation protein A [Gammaproteobacteria bacterium]|nr:segregation/condensation protein A [Gammaproteobacteria bacterium]
MTEPVAVIGAPLHEPASPQQEEMPFAIVQGAPFTEMPKDLYIPPHALEVILEAFEGPLDLLLWLIKRQNLDILNIPIAEITRQYVEYVELMKEMELELAAEYLVMAAVLAEIKSRMLLPRPPSVEGEEDDPRAELVRRLQEYERFKQAAEDIDALPRLGRDVFSGAAELTDRNATRPLPTVDLRDILAAMAEVMKRAEMFAHHHIQREPLSVRQRMSEVLEHLSTERFTEFPSLFRLEEGRRGLVVTLIAVLELLKQQMIELIQTAAFATIHVKLVAPDMTPAELDEAADYR